MRKREGISKECLFCYITSDRIKQNESTRDSTCAAPEQAQQSWLGATRGDSAKAQQHNAGFLFPGTMHTFCFAAAADNCHPQEQRKHPTPASHKQRREAFVNYSSCGSSLQIKRVFLLWLIKNAIWSFLRQKTSSK